MSTPEDPEKLLGRDTLPVPPLKLDSGEDTFGLGAVLEAHLPGLDAGAVVAGRFRVVRLLGKGGMGEVYEAEDATLGRKVALKVLSRSLASDPQFAQRFRREARAASALSHPGVCVIYEIGESAVGGLYIAMELLEGESLDVRVKRKRLEIREVVDVGAQIADALAAAHSKGIIHRDIKAANVVLMPDGRVKVLDFGLAKHLEGMPSGALAAATSLTTRAGILVGTPQYMSPEQARGMEVDQRSDIFSLGAVLYEMVTGRPPFEGETVGQVIERVLGAQPEAMARFNYDLPPELERIVRKCLEKSPDRRYQSAKELSIDLKNLERDLARSAESHEAQAPAIGQGAEGADRGAAAEARPVEELKQSDVFLTYASVDDQPVVTGRQGWISQFQRNLRVRMEQLSGESVRIWPQANPLGRDASSQEVTRGLPEVKTLVSVVSPPFVRSEGCRAQVSTFWRHAEQRGQLEVESRSRVFKVVKWPVDSRELPADLAPYLGRLKGFEFFEHDPETGRVREFDETFGDLARQRYQERVYDVAFEVSQVLKYLRGQPAGRLRPATDALVIFLAATTADLAAQRDQLQRELTELGHTVVPDRPLPLIASELEEVVRTTLAECGVAIHLVGDRYGLVPEDTELSIVALQNRIAAEASAGSKLERFVWMPRGLTPRDERQAAFIRNLVRDPTTHRGAEVISDTLENFKTLLRARWQKKPALPAPVGGAEAPPRVYIICEPRDEEGLEPLEDFFYNHGVEVSLPGLEASEAEAQEIHIRNLTDCDGALIYYGAAGNHWVDFNIRDLEKAAGYRDSVPIAARAVYVAPPTNHRKERFKSLRVDVLRPTGDGFDPSVLEPFVALLKSAKRGAP